MTRTVVTLCGSTRFYEQFQRAYYEETMKGSIVLSVGFFMHSAEQAHGESIGCTEEQKQELDRLHMDKIDMSDEILVLNVEGYVGSSTTNEIRHARDEWKRIRFLEPDNIPEHVQQLLQEEAVGDPLEQGTNILTPHESRLAAEAHKSVSYEMIDYNGAGPRWGSSKRGKDNK